MIHSPDFLFCLLYTDTIVKTVQRILSDLQLIKTTALNEVDFELPIIEPQTNTQLLWKSSRRK